MKSEKPIPWCFTLAIFFLLAGLSLLSGLLYWISSASTGKVDRQSTTILAVFSILKKALLKPGVLYLSFSAFSFFVNPVSQVSIKYFQPA